MATRDRTPSFNLLKSEYKNRKPAKKDRFNNEIDEDSNNVPLVQIKGDKGDISNIKQPPLFNEPQWMVVVRPIDQNLKKISELIDQLKKFHDKNLLPDMSMEDQSSLERSIEITTAETTRLFHKTHDFIKSIGKGPELSIEDQKMKKNIQSSKSAKLQALSLAFRQKQRKYLTALQKRSNSFSDWGIDNNGNDDDEDSTLIELDFSDELKQVVNKMDEEITQRDKEIRAIVASVNELSHLFQDIATLVIQQGTLFDRIDYNLDQTVEDLHVADKVIIDTDKIHKGYRNRLCILMVLVGLVVAMVFIFILKFTIF